MNLKGRQFLIGSAAALIALAGIAVALAAWFLPLRVDAPRSSTKAPPGSASAPARLASPGVDLAELLRLCARDLRRLPAADSAATAAPSGAPLTLQLIGTANEPGHSIAMLRKGDGAVALCALGDSVDDVGGAVTVTRIDADRIAVQYAGTTRELLMPLKPLNVEAGEP